MKLYPLHIMTSWFILVLKIYEIYKFGSITLQLVCCSDSNPVNYWNMLCLIPHANLILNSND